MPEGVRVTGVIYLPWRPGDPITKARNRGVLPPGGAAAPGKA
ncbi:hypothetical protein [Agromyces humatus]|nr:hypothetical protein [Agromyces humatus]